MVFTVDIDFDSAAVAWRANKVYLGNGSFAYRGADHTRSAKVEDKGKLPSRYNLRSRTKKDRDSKTTLNHSYNLRSNTLN